MSLNMIHDGSDKISFSCLYPNFLHTLRGWLASRLLRGFAGPMYRDFAGRWWTLKELSHTSLAEKPKTDGQSLSRSPQRPGVFYWMDEKGMLQSWDLSSPTTKAAPQSAPRKRRGGKRSNVRASRASGS